MNISIGSESYRAERSMIRNVMMYERIERGEKQMFLGLIKYQLSWESYFIEIYRRNYLHLIIICFQLVKYSFPPIHFYKPYDNSCRSLLRGKIHYLKMWRFLTKSNLCFLAKAQPKVVQHRLHILKSTKLQKKDKSRKKDHLKYQLSILFISPV